MAAEADRGHRARGASTSCSSGSTRCPTRRARDGHGDRAGAAELYGDGLARIVARVGPATARAPPSDELVAHLLLLHGLHPVPVEERVRDALDGVRPYLDSHGGGVELLGVEDGVVQLRLEGSCDGCPSSTATLKLRDRGGDPDGRADVERVEARRRRRRRRRLLQIERARALAAGRAAFRRERAVDELAPAPARRRRAAVGPAPTVLGALRPVRRAVAPGHRHLVDLRLPRAAVRLPRLRDPVRPSRGGRRAPTGWFRCGGAARRLRARRRAVGAAAAPGRAGVLLLRSAAGPRRRALPEPDGRDRVAAELDAWTELAAPTRRWAAGARRRGAARQPRARGREHWLVPIDDCYAHVGLIRSRWRGFSGGDEVWQAIAHFFDDLRRRRPGADDDDQGRQRDVRPDAPAHTPGIQQGNRWAAMSASAGHPPDGRSTARRSTGFNARRVSRRPAHADPLAA